MHPTALNPGERVDCFPLGVALATDEEEVLVEETTTEEDMTTRRLGGCEGLPTKEEGPTDAAEDEDGAALEDAELEVGTAGAATLEEAAWEETTALEDATMLDEATEEDATFGTG
ncbi:hypothetical protein QFC19_004024 [Naganishia cerealis]|uniref:Uncharacterized protein n=1 Tax=Naganishia cerealis TaxID=610337 RepID=A0ACC2W0M5_9TREE|nr:hypothetical protein QFC19_004024 [Naganishia cerealis]